NLRAPDLPEPARTLALSQPRPGHVLRPRGPDPALPAESQGRGAAGAGRDVLGPAGPAAPRHQSREHLGDVPRAAGDRRVRLRPPDVTAAAARLALMVIAAAGCWPGLARAVCTPSPLPPQTPLAVVLSGGGAKGAYEAGVAATFLRRALPIRLAAGSSAGALN